MTSKRTQFSTSVKTIPDSQPYRRTATLQRQQSFRDENEPAAASIRSISPTSHVKEPSPEQDATSDNEEANTTIYTQQPLDNLDSDKEENPVLVGLRKAMPSLPLSSATEDRPAQGNVASSHSAQVGNFLAQLEIRWQETYDELTKIAQIAGDSLLPQDHLNWYRSRCAYLQGQERSLRDDIRRLTPTPPPPIEPHLRAYHEALTAYGEALRLYWSRP
ncbi:hypothetical protein BGZ88_005710, partial [Linnemannia elongata]